MTVGKEDNARQGGAQEGACGQGGDTVAPLARWPGDLPGLEALVDRLPVFAYRSRLEGETWVLEYISGGVEEVTGHAVAEFLDTRRQANVTLILPEDQAWIWPRLRDLLAARQPYAFEYRIRSAAGEIRWLLDKGRGLYATDGSLTGVEGFATDITAHKHADEALQASREEWQALFENAADAVFVADAATGTILDANAAAERLMSLPRKRLIGMHQSALHPPEMGALVRTVFGAHASGGGPGTADLEVLTGDGRRVPVQIVGSTVVFRGGRRVVQGRFRDLSSVREAERAAIDMRHLVEVVLATGPVNLAITDAALLLRYVDPGWREAHGDPTGRPWDEYFAWRPPLGVKELVQEALSAGAKISRDIAGPGPGARILGITVVPFRNAAGEWLVAAFESDVTAVHQAAAALRRSEERYRRLFELESDAIVLLQASDCRILDANRAAESLFGYSREELLALHNYDIGGVPGRAEAAIAQRLPYVPIGQGRRKDGTVFPIEVTLSYFEDAGQPVCLAALRDISARIRAAQELEVSARRLALLLDSLPGFAFQGRFHPEWRVDFVSEGILGVTGYPASDFVGGKRTVESLILPEDYDSVEAEIERELMAHGSYAVRFRIRHASGDVRWLLTQCKGTLEGGQMVGAEGFTTDITALGRAEEERELLQEQLLQAHKMESIGRLAGGVAHDFNNLLTVILGACEAIEESAHAAAILTEVRQIRQASARARSLTRQLLAYGRRQMLSLRPTDLSKVVRDHLDLLRRLIGEDVRIDTVLAPDLWRVRGDEAQLTQVLTNLAANARDAMPAGGTLALQTENRVVASSDDAPVPGTAPGEYVLLTVSDTGCGMTTETREHAFEPFFSTKDPSKGAGLGLATVHGIISQHGGRICVNSAPGQGARFRIVLPRLPPDAAGEPSPDPASAAPLLPGAGRTVLLVEDDPDVRRMVHASIARQGYRVESAASPEEALATAERMGALDLVVADVVLTGMSGPDLYARIAARRPGLKALFISGYPGSVMADRGGPEDSLRFLQKPFSARELTARLGDILAAPAEAPAMGPP